MKPSDLFRMTVTVKESSELAKLADPKKADQLEVGSKILVTGPVAAKGSKGVITGFSADKSLVKVRLENGETKSFYSHDITEPEDEFEPEGEHTKIYVAFYNTDEERAWIGIVTKEGGGKWHEKAYKGTPDPRWGSTYMSYLTPHDIMSYIHREFRRSMDIEGPFYNPHDAIQYVQHSFGGKLAEAVEDDLLTALRDANKSLLRNKGGYSKEMWDKIQDIYGSLRRCLMNGDIKSFNDVYDREAEQEPDAFDEFVDALFNVTDSKSHDEFAKKFKLNKLSEEVSQANTSKFIAHAKNGQVNVHANGKKIASFSTTEWKNLLAAVKNHVEGKFGKVTIKHQGDSVEFLDAEGEEIASIPANEIFELAHTRMAEEVFHDYASWKKAVLAANPKYADKIKFKGSSDKGASTEVKAEVPGLDRLFGFYDIEKDEGELLGEGIGDSSSLSRGELLVKAAKVIQSAKTLDQLKVAQRYCDLATTDMTRKDKEDSVSLAQAIKNLQPRLRAVKADLEKKRKELTMENVSEALSDFKKREIAHELRHEDAKKKFGLKIDGKLWKKGGKTVSFDTRAQASRAAASPALSAKKTEIVAVYEDAEV